MRIYLAAPWADRVLARDTATRLRALGHTLTHDWWDFDGTESDPAYLTRCAWWDWCAVDEAEILLLLDTQMSEGKCIEQGLALAAGTPILAVGVPGRNIFHHLPAYTWVPTIEAALDLLTEKPR